MTSTKQMFLTSGLNFDTRYIYLFFLFICYVLLSILVVTLYLFIIFFVLWLQIWKEEMELIHLGNVKLPEEIDK
jgi:hypothetical protein